METSETSVGASDRLSLDLFEETSIGPTDREVAVPLTPRYSTYKKLEVVNARRINTMAAFFNTASFAALSVSILVILLSRFAFSKVYTDIPGLQPNTLLDVTVYEFPPVFALIDSILNFVVFAYAVVLFCAFCIVLLRAGKQRVLNEQIWVVMLLLGCVLYLNPHEASVRLRRDYLGLKDPTSEGGFNHIDIFTCLRLVSFSVVSILYLWMGSHSYRYLSRRISYRDWRFYTKKVFVVLIYNAYKLSILFRYRIIFSEVPLATFIAFLQLYGKLGSWPGLGVTTVTILTVMEAIILGLVVADVFKTQRLLREADYVKHRTKIVGFRFFLHQQIIFYSVYIVTYLLILFGLPNGIQILQFALFAQDGDGRGSYFDIQYAPLGLQFCILAYVTTEAYTNLPASLTVRSPFAKSHRNAKAEEAIEPIVYRNREPPSFSGMEPELRPNCFIMQTNIELFNLAWFVYYQGTRKEQNLNVDFSTLTLKLQESLYSKETDTRALVAASTDRIVIAFKGTTSSQNLFTDIKVLHRPLSQVISLRKDSSESVGEDTTRVTDIMASMTFKKAKVHAGFFDAYNSIKEDLLAVTANLLHEKPRPVYFTGHSLGGALATISSLDVSLTLDVPGKNIVVTSFGSPRVGNRSFQEVYDGTVPMNWRVVAGGDIVSRLPKVGYEHVGKKVMLTAGGDLFIDPNVLDMLFLHSQPASLVHHRKSCYLLALKSWCDSRDSDYVPNFWPFPISANDSRKFDVTFRKPNSSNFSPRSRRDRASARAKKYQIWADAIDNLDAPIRNERALESWRRLGAPILQVVRNEQKGQQAGDL